MDTRFPITLPAGVVRNDSAYAVKGRYINSSFIHFWEGKPQKWGGWGNYFNLAFTEPARGGVIWNANDGRTLSAFGTANKLWLMREGALYDITPNGLASGLVSSATTDSGWGAGGWGSGPWGGGWTAFAGQGSFPRVWTVCKWGEDLVACPRGGPIYFWDYSAANLGITMTGTLDTGNDSHTKVLLHFDGSDASTTFTDSNAGGSAHTWTAHGDAQIDTADKEFGTASGLFDGTGDYIDAPDHADFALGSGDFTIDCWFKCTATTGSPRRIAGQCDATSVGVGNSFNLRRLGVTDVLFARVSVGTTNYDVQTTAQYTDLVNPGWHHAAVVRFGGMLTLYVDGVSAQSTAITGTVNDISNNLSVGRMGEVVGGEWQGWIDEFRLSAGIARWTANFTPPTRAYSAPAISALSNDTAIKVGDRVTGTGIPVDTFVSSVNTGAHTMVISNGATIAGVGVTLTFTTPAVALSTLTVDAALPSVALGIFVTDDRELVAFGAAQSPNTYDALNIAWCDREDFTVWTPTQTNTAGAIRCETGNQIMGAVRVFGGWLILTDLSAHPFTFQGGDDIWGLDRVGSTGGAISPHAMIEVDGVAYWMGPNAIHSYNGRVNTVPCDVHEAVYNNINRLQAYKICAGTVRRYGLILWFIPGTLTSLENDSYFGVNTFDSSWELGGALASTASDPVADFSRTTWIDSNALFKTPLGTDGANYKIYQHEAGTTADGVDIPYLLETGEIELKAQGGSIQASDTFIRLKKVAPDWAYISGAHSLTVKARGYSNDPEVEKGPYDMTGVMFNPKARGRTFRFLITGTGDMRLGDMEAYGSPDGGRR